MKSSFSNSDCVEVDYDLGSDTMTVSDSKDPRGELGALLVFTRAEWEAFVKGVKAGEFDYLDGVPSPT